jgi:nitrous oxide reductase accessory protein NosL
MTMKLTIVRSLVLTVFLVCSLLSAGTVTAQAAPVEAPEACDKCGMNRTKFARSRVLVEFEDGSTGGTCSITCASYDVRQKSKKKVKRLLVADYDSRELIVVHDAVWVTGGDVHGVMTKVPKWAFKNKEGADRFITAHGGKIATWDEVIVGAKQETCKCGKHGAKQSDKQGDRKHGSDEKPCHDQKL